MVMIKQYIVVVVAAAAVTVSFNVVVFGTMYTHILVYRSRKSHVLQQVPLQLFMLKDFWEMYRVYNYLAVNLMTFLA